MMNRTDAVARYIAIAPRLPSANFPQESIHVAHLAELDAHIDAFVLDGFGVLNVGDEVIPGVADRLTTLRTQGKKLIVLTNGATLPAHLTARKYARWQLPIEANDVVSSRDALVIGMQTYPETFKWGVAAPPHAEVEALPGKAQRLLPEPDQLAQFDGFVLLSVRDWSVALHELVLQSLRANPRPLLVGNPDLVAPLSDHLSQEPGFFAHKLADTGVISPDFYGKPFANAFDIVKQKLHGIPPQRIAMVGDTLHTDILGGAAAGWRTVLITGHGLMRGMDVEAAIQQSGIRPDFIAPTT